MPWRACAVSGELWCKLSTCMEAEAGMHFSALEPFSPQRKTLDARKPRLERTRTHNASGNLRTVCLERPPSRISRCLEPLRPGPRPRSKREQDSAVSAMLHPDDSDAVHASSTYPHTLAQTRASRSLPHLVLSCLVTNQSQIWGSRDLGGPRLFLPTNSGGLWGRQFRRRRVP